MQKSFILELMLKTVSQKYQMQVSVSSKIKINETKINDTKEVGVILSNHTAIFLVKLLMKIRKYIYNLHYIGNM